MALLPQLEWPASRRLAADTGTFGSICRGPPPVIVASGSSRRKESTMAVTGDNRLVGASVFEQEAFDALLAHERDEEGVIAAYETFAKDVPSEVVRYLIELIVEDERRHHRVLDGLANSIRAQATFD